MIAGDAKGGALFVTSHTAVVSRCEFVENNASGGDGFYHYARSGKGIGGAIYNLASLSISDTTFSTNAALAGNFRLCLKAGVEAAFLIRGLLTSLAPHSTITSLAAVKPVFTLLWAEPPETPMEAQFSIAALYRQRIARLH
jgi:hypothetical protein